MKCKWYAEFEGVCTNGECPYCSDVCPTSEHPEVCKYAEEKPKPELNAEELVTALRLCAGATCEGCPCEELVGCNGYVKRKAADMLEKLAEEIEKERKRRERAMKTPDEIKKALECHRDGRACHDCPYEQGRTFSVDGVTFGCTKAIIADALACIEQLESRVKTDKE